MNWNVSLIISQNFSNEAKRNDFECVDMQEWFDEEGAVPRLLTMVFKKYST